MNKCTCYACRYHRWHNIANGLFICAVIAAMWVFFEAFAILLS